MHKNELVRGQTPPLANFLRFLQALILVTLMLSSTTAECCQQPEQQCQWKLKQMLIVLHAGSKCTLNVLLQLGINWAGPNPKLRQKSPAPPNCLDVKVPVSPLWTRGLSAYLLFCQHPCCWSAGDPLAWRQLGSAECLGLVMFVWRKAGRMRY